MNKSAFIFLLFTTFYTIAQDLPCKFKYPDQRCKERYLENSQGQKHGKYISYYQDGTVAKVQYYSNGKLNGVSTESYNWGKYITTYLNGIENGLYQKLTADGKILEKGNYKNGKKDGYWIEYDGKDKGNYTNGAKHGIWEIYRDGWNGPAGITKGEFVNGEHVGTWTNLVVIGTKKSNSLTLNTQKEIAYPATNGYTELQEYYIEGYKAIFNTEGYYVEAYDATGSAIINPKKSQ